MGTMRQSSVCEWTSSDNLDQINAGSLQRIADAAERMAVNHRDLISERDRFERYFREEQAKVGKLRRSNISLRGVITRLKNAAERKGEVSG